jgi:hypothetical protein
MRMIFGVLSLLVALAIVGTLAKKQLQALGSGSVKTRISEAASAAQVGGVATGDRDGATLAIPGGMPGAVAADTAGLTVPQQAQNIQQQFRENTNRALEQGAERNSRASP